MSGGSEIKSTQFAAKRVGKGKFGVAASCAIMGWMVIARIAKAHATNDHRRAFKFP